MTSQTFNFEMRYLKYRLFNRCQIFGSSLCSSCIRPFITKILFIKWSRDCSHSIYIKTERNRRDNRNASKSGRSLYTFQLASDPHPKGINCRYNIQGIGFGCHWHQIHIRTASNPCTISKGLDSVVDQQRTHWL